MRNALIALTLLFASLPVASCTYERRPTVAEDMGAKPDLWMPLFPDCMDKFKNLDETDIDCGGSCMKKCLDGQGCKTKADCQSAICIMGACAPTTICLNGVRDGDESDIDCGGSCAGCGFGKVCKAPTDCKSGACAAGTCAAIKAAFSPGKGVNIGTQPLSLVVADIDGDKIVDLIAHSGMDDKINIVLGRADGKYGMPVAVMCPKATTADSLAAGDIDGDGKIDLAATSEDMAYVLINDSTAGKPAFKMPKALSSAGMLPTTPRLVDLTRDGKPELVTLDAEYDFNNTGYYIFVAVNAGGGMWSGPKRIFAGADLPVTPHFADINDDGQIDIIGLTGSTVSVGPGKGDGSVGNWVRSKIEMFSAKQIAVGDFDPNGSLDVLAVDRAGALGVMAGTGDGMLGRIISVAKPSTPAAIVVADFDLDDKLDAVTLDGFNDVVELFLGQGGRKFTAAASVMAGTSPGLLIAADANQDGKMDLLTTNPGTDQITLILNASK